jgi:hypothetical protein
MFGIPAEVLSANSFKIGGGSAEVAAAWSHARKQAQLRFRHKSAAASEHYIRYANDGGDGVASHWDDELTPELTTLSVKRGAAIFREQTKKPNKKRVSFNVRNDEGEDTHRRR